VAAWWRKHGRQPCRCHPGVPPEQRPSCVHAFRFTVRRFIGAKTGVYKPIGGEPKRRADYGTFDDRHPMTVRIDPDPKRSTILAGGRLKLIAGSFFESAPYDRARAALNPENAALLAHEEMLREQPDLEVGSDSETEIE
jgi:hypothetical protein